MNKKTIRIAGWALGLSMAVAGIGVAVGANYVANSEPIMAKAAEVTTSYTFIDRNLKHDAQAEAAWTSNPAFSSFESSNNARGPQSSKATSDITISSSSSVNNVKSVKITASANGACTATTKVGNTVFGSANTSIAKGSSNAVFTFANQSVSNGTITITISRSTSCTFWLKAIEVITDEPAIPSGKVHPLTISVKQGDNLVGDAYLFNGTIGNTVTFTSHATYESGDGFVDGLNYSWHSSNTDVATITSLGVATIKAKGSSTITLSTVDASQGYENISVQFTLNSNGASYAKGTDVSVPYGVNDAVSDFSTIGNKNVYIEGYITSWYNDTYAYITDTKTPGNADQKIEVYTKNHTVNFLQGEESQYVTGSKVIVYGTLVLFNSTVYEFNSDLDIYITEVEEVSNIAVKTGPDKNAYNVGETFLPSGLVITVNYPSRQYDVDYDEVSGSGFAFSPSLSTQFKAGDDHVTVTYLGKTVDIPVTIDSAIHTESVTIKMGGETIPGKTLSRALDAGNIVLTADLEPANSEDEIVWSTNDSTIATVSNGSVAFGSKTGAVRITATSGGKSDYVDITLTDPSDAVVSSIEIVEGSGVIKDYYNDTELDTTGLSVRATYSSDNKGEWIKTVDNFSELITWSLDRENSFVVAKYNNSETIKDTLAVTVHNSDKPLQFSWNLTVVSYVIDSVDSVTWSSDYASVNNVTAEGGTSATNYLGGDANKRTSSRMYKDNVLTITPSDGYLLSSLTFTATSEGYATALKNSAWTNATASASGTVVTVTATKGSLPIQATIGGTCGFNEIELNYQKSWAKILLDKFTCSGVTQENPNGAITAYNSSSVWSEIESTFDVMTSEQKAALKTVEANVGGTITEQALARYDLVIKKYGTGTYADFLGRFSNGGINYGAYIVENFGNHSDSDPSLPLLITIASAGLLTAGGLLITRKRRSED